MEKNWPYMYGYLKGAVDSYSFWRNELTDRGWSDRVDYDTFIDLCESLAKIGAKQAGEAEKSAREHDEEMKGNSDKIF